VTLTVSLDLKNQLLKHDWYIYDHIVEKIGYTQRAWKYVEKLRSKCADLDYAPQRGIKRDDLMHGLRIVAVDKKTVIACLVKEKAAEVHILNVIYGGRDYESLFEDS